MKTTRRELMIGVSEALGAGVVLTFFPSSAQAYLVGTWLLKCPYCGQIDTVTGGTKQHVCENNNCGRQVFDGNTVTIACPPKKHPNRVDTGTGAMTSLKCATCGEECRIPEPKSGRDHGGRGGTDQPRRL